MKLSKLIALIFIGGLCLFHTSEADAAFAVACQVEYIDMENACGEYYAATVRFSHECEEGLVYDPIRDPDEHEEYCRELMASLRLLKGHCDRAKADFAICKLVGDYNRDPNSYIHERMVVRPEQY